MKKLLLAIALLAATTLSATAQWANDAVTGASGGGSGCTTSGASILYGNGSGGCSNVTIGANLTFSGGSLSASSTAPGGSSGQIQYNNAGAFGGLAIGATLKNNSGTLDVAGSVVAGTTQTVTATQWNAGTTFRVTTAAQTLTLPASSTLSVNGGLLIQTIGQSVTLTPNAADAINGGTAGTSVTISAGVSSYVTTDGAGNISATPTTAGSSGANPTATASDVAVNGSATTFMRSDAAPAVQKGSSSAFGIVKVDGTTITATGGVITATAGGSGCTITGSQFQIVAVNAGGTGCTADANATVNAGALSLGASGTPGSVAMGNATSGVLTLAPVTGALGTVTASFPANTGTVAEINLAQAWTATQTFAGVLGSTNTQSGTTYTLVASDCGKTVVFTSATAVTVTIPASIVPATGTACAIAIFQSGAGQVSVNGTAVSAATLVSSHAYTKTFGQSAMIGLTLTTIGATATAVLSGDGA